MSTAQTTPNLRTPLSTSRSASISNTSISNIDTSSHKSHDLPTTTTTTTTTTTMNNNPPLPCTINSSNAHELNTYPTPPPTSPPLPSTTNNPPPTDWRPTTHHHLLFLTLALPSFLVALDSTILISTLPTLSHSLQSPTTTTFWAASAYLLPYATLQPLLLSLSDIFGRRAGLLVSLVFFTLGSLPCALARNMGTLIAGRVVQGIGGGGVVGLTQAVYADVVPLRVRPRWFGVNLLAWAVGVMVGPVVGGVFSEMGREGWRWCFWVNLPVGGVAGGLVWGVVRLDRVRDGRGGGGEGAEEGLVWRKKLGMVDYVGGLVFVGSVTSMLVAVSWGGNQYAWGSVQTVVPFVVGALGLGVFVLWEWKEARYPFVVRGVFPSVSAVLLFTMAFLFGVTMFMATYYVCFYFSVVKLVGATEAGRNMLAGLGPSLPTSIVCGILMSKLGRWRWSMWGGHAVETLGFGLLYLLDDKTPARVWVPILCVVGVGVGMSLSSLTFGVQTTTRTDRDSANATVMYTFLRSVGMCVGVSLGSTIFQNVASGYLEDLGRNREIAKNAEAFVSGQLRFMSPDDPMRQDVVAAFVGGLRGVWIVLTAIQGAALLMSFFISRRTMDRALDGRYVVADRERVDV